MFELNNKKTVITGGGSGIGKAVSLLFAKQGAEVFVLDLNKERCDETCEEIKNSGGKACNDGL